MNRSYRAAACVLALLASCVPGETLWAQHSDHHGGHLHQGAPTAAQDSLRVLFVARARAATEAYHDLNAAIAAGYRLVGPDFPGMGEHWVHTRRIVQRELSVEHPAILSYLRIDGEPVLTGVAYARPVGAGEAPPDFILPGLWHFHTGSIDEETLILNPEAMHHSPEDQPRLAMFHAWIWTENPDGLFAQDNWALPFLRLGLPLPPRTPPQAGKALFLLSDGVAYYARLIDIAGEPDEADRAQVKAVLERYHAQAAAHYQALRTAGSVTEADVAQLAALWQALWNELEQTISPALWSNIHPLAG